MSSHEQGDFFKNGGRVMTQHQEFVKLTGQRYLAMKQKWENVRDQVYPPLKLPFTVEQFRGFLIWLLGGEQGTCRCEYCNRPLDLLRLQLDHRMPPDRGHSMQECNELLDFKNLAPCCDHCNQRKGFMSAVAFQHLLELVRDTKKFEQLDCDNLLGRLQSQQKLARRVRTLTKSLQDASGAPKWGPVRISPIKRQRQAPVGN